MLHQLFLLLIGLGRLKVLLFDDIPELEYIQRSQTPRSKLEKRGAAEFFLTNFEVFGNRRKHFFECLM